MLLGLFASSAGQSGTYINTTRYATQSLTGFSGGITAGPDGAIWFTENQGQKIGRITTAGVLTEFPVAGIAPFTITAGPDGALWFTENPGGKNIGKITTAGVITEYPVRGPTDGITTGPDGALWFTEFDTNVIGRITTAGVIKEHLLSFGGNPSQIASGPDGALWFTLQNSDEIGRITTTGVATQFALPADSFPAGITAGPDGALWFAEYGLSQIGRITTSGVIQQYKLSQAPYSITAGPDGALWFGEEDADRIGRITTAGVITEYASNYGPSAITPGPDGNVWFVDVAGGVSHAPACGLGFSASFASGTLTMNFNLGINTPATFNIVLLDANGPFAHPFSQAIPAVAPPHAFSMNWSPFPNKGTITVRPELGTAPGQGLCAEWTTVNTAQ